MFKETVTIGNENYIVTTEEAYNALLNAKRGVGQQEVDEVIQMFSSSITKEDDLQELDEESPSSGGTTPASTPSNSTPASTTGSTNSGNATGFNYEAYEQYSYAVGLNTLDEDSSVDDLVNVFKEIEKITRNIDLKISSLNTDDPAALEKEMDEITSMGAIVSQLGEMAGADMPKEGTWSKVGIGAGVGVAVIGAIAIKAGAIGVLASAGGIAAAVGTIPVAGWVAGAAIFLGGCIWAGITAYNNSKNQEKLENLQKKIVDTANKLSGSYDTMSEKIETGAKNQVKKTNEALKGLMGDKFDFKDITDVSSVTKNIDKIIEQQGKLEPWKHLADKYGIQVDGLDSAIEKLGSGDDRLQYAQKYFDDYIAQVDMGIKDEVVTDTATLNTLYSNLNKFGSEMEQKGIDISSLTQFLQKVREQNLQETNDTAAKIVSDAGLGAGPSGGSGYVQDASAAYQAAGLANQTASGVVDGSTSYETSTQSLQETEQQMKETAQKAVDDYVASISTDGKSISELEELYNEVSSNKTAFEEISSELDLSKIPGKLDEIRKAQQTLADEYINSVEISGKSIAELESIHGAVSQRKAEIESVTSALDLSKYDTKCTEIRTAQQTAADELIATVNTAGMGIGELENLYNAVAQTKADIEGVTTALDLSKYDTKCTEIRAAQQAAADEFINNIQLNSSSIGELQNTYNQVSGMQESIQGMTSAIDTSAYTAKLQEIRAAQQGIIDNYASTLQISDKSIEELQGMYGEITQSQAAIAELTSELDTSALTTCLESIKAAQQTQVDTYVADAQARAGSTGSTIERKQLMDELDLYSAQYQAYGLDLSGIAGCKEAVMQAEQAYVGELALQYTQEGNNATTAEGVQAVIDKVNLAITASGELGCDISPLVTLSGALTQKLASIKPPEGDDDNDDDNDNDNDNDDDTATGGLPPVQDDTTMTIGLPPREGDGDLPPIQDDTEMSIGLPPQEADGDLPPIQDDTEMSIGLPPQEADGDLPPIQDDTLPPQEGVTPAQTPAEGETTVVEGVGNDNTNPDVAVTVPVAQPETVPDSPCDPEEELHSDMQPTPEAGDSETAEIPVEEGEPLIVVTEEDEI